MDNLLISKGFSGSILLEKGGQMLLEKSYGTADRASNTPNTPQTKIPIFGINYYWMGVQHMHLDQFTVAALILRPDAPQLDDEAEAELQDAHTAHLADLHDAGHLLAAGPLLGNDTFRGLSILRAGPDEARRLKEQDPAVRAGRYSITVLPWLVPGGAISFTRTSFPRSMGEVQGD